MCGIGGYFLWKRVSPPPLGEALSLLAHRGPDAARIWYSSSGHVGLAHTRLSILDLSEAAHQPFHFDTFHLVYNGEIYNFREIAQKGRFTLRTRSDTEVILHAYKHWGEAALNELEGMFAFALYDEEKNELLLARDPFGIKPLWVATRPEGIYFASELKVLKAWLKDLSIRPEAIPEFLHLGFIPAPHSWYEGIYKVLPGEAWRIHEERFTRWTYYERPLLWQQEELQEPLPEIEARIHTCLRQAVKAHLVSDVPVGLFLSGGTDSSLVAAIAQENGQSLQAFSIGFAEGKFNELPYARAVASHLGIPLVEAILGPTEALELLTRLSEWFDEPFGDISALPTYLVSRLAASQVKVVLAGDGGDELFWGYGRYLWVKRIQYSPPFLTQVGSWTLQRSPMSKARRVGRLLQLPPEARTEHIFSQEQHTFSWREIKEICPSARNPWKTPYPLPNEKIRAQAAWDFLHYLPDDLLTKVDRASMQHSLEVRVPLLDKRFVELAWRVPQRWKHPQGAFPVQYKPLLRRLLRRYLPAPLVERKKWGFTIPLAQWLRGPLRDWLRTYADEASLARRYELSPHPLRRLWRAFMDGDDLLATRLWLLAQIGSHANA
ncbi:MAG: asparagine synthase (glutamine-hydrolyzing) [Bacteroidia bacterium]|nr:asparagine synthase (glutamine-hydrolyzing) [Bacteroidia bacterium]